LHSVISVALTFADASAAHEMDSQDLRAPEIADAR
jgi:hypothetical protein